MLRRVLALGQLLADGEGEVGSGPEPVLRWGASEAWQEKVSPTA